MSLDFSILTATNDSHGAGYAWTICTSVDVEMPEIPTLYSLMNTHGRVYLYL
jgi:hypothetical protein